MSICTSVRLSVCSLLRYRLTVFLPPLPEVGCPIFLKIRNPWGKVIKRSGLTFEYFCLKIVQNRRAKKSFFCCWFCGPVSVRRLYNDMRRLYWDMRRLYNNMRQLYWDTRRLYMMRVLGYSWSTLLWHLCYYPHRSRDALSPVCGIFIDKVWWMALDALWRLHEV